MVIYILGDQYKYACPLLSSYPIIIFPTISPIYILQQWQLILKLSDVSSCPFHIYHFHACLFFASLFHICLFIFIYCTHSIVLMLTQFCLHNQVSSPISFLNYCQIYVLLYITQLLKYHVSCVCTSIWCLPY